LFADKVIMVEGLAEQLLLPCLAAYKKFDDENGITQEEELTNQHVCIVSVDSRTFNHFLKLYAYSDDNPCAINKKVVCITDADPTIDGKACFPFQLNGQGTALASHLTTLQTKFEQKFNNINVYHPVEGKGKTLEYEIVGCNPKSELILTSSFPSQNSANTIDNFKLLQTELDSNPDDYKKIAETYRGFKLTDKQEEKLYKYCQCLEAKDIENDEKSIALLSALYYNVVSDIKGEHSMMLEANLREDLAKETPEFRVPDYITDALTKILE